MVKFVDDDDKTKTPKKTPLSDIKKKKHPDKIVSYIRFVYIIGILIWILILHFLKLYHMDIYSLGILILPFFCFFVGFINANEITGEIEDELFKTNYLSVGLILVLPLLTWVNKDFSGDKRMFTKILVLAIMFTLLSMIDIWVSDNMLPVMKHVKSVLQTFSLTLMIFGLYSYYSKKPDGILV